MRLLAALLGLVVATSLVFGTGGFSAASLERGVEIGVAPDHGQAIISLWNPGDEPGSTQMDTANQVTADGDGVPILVVKNRFSDSVDVTVRAHEGSVVAIEGSHDNLAPESMVTISGEVDCQSVSGVTDVPLVVSVNSRDGSFAGVIDYSTTVHCSPPSDPTATDS